MRKPNATYFNAPEGMKHISQIIRLKICYDENKYIDCRIVCIDCEVVLWSMQEQLLI